MCCLLNGHVSNIMHKVPIADDGFSLDLRSADKELKAVTPEK